MPRYWQACNNTSALRSSLARAATERWRSVERVALLDRLEPRAVLPVLGLNILLRRTPVCLGRVRVGMGQSMRVGQRVGLQLGMRVESGAEGYDDLLGW